MPQLSAQVTAEDHILGAKLGVYTLVQYGDLQCPDTAMAEPELQEIMQQMEGKIRLVYRHYPLADIHPFATIAAEAVEAAGAQGKFWQMRTMLLENQDHLDRDSLVAYASELSLDTARFKQDLDSHKYAKKIDSDVKSALQSEVESTPTYFLNGSMVEQGLELTEVFDSLEETDEDEDEDW